MKPALQIQVKQGLALTPQLQQAIRLLQLSQLELEMELSEAMESNPLLELAEDDAENDEGGDDERFGEATAPETTVAPAPDSDMSSDSSERVEHDNSPLDLALERNDYRNAASSDDEHLEPEDAAMQGLRDHLLWQLNLTPMSQVDHAIAMTIIDSVDDGGYLTESNEAIAASLAAIHDVDDEQVEAVRHRVQQFDPTGVASRSLRECLLVQLDALDVATPGLICARAIVDEHLELLGRNDRAKIGQRLRTEGDEIDVAIDLVRSLSPRPGAGWSSAAPEFIAPDAYAIKVNNRWQVSLAPGCQPRMAINQHYASLIAQVRRDDANYLRGQLQEARWLIKSLQTRAETIVKVATAIVRAQESFLEFGPEAMRPLVLKDVASEIEMHESTVSRVTTRKYLHTPRGTFEFKYFFSSGVTTVDGGAASATAIQAMIRKLVAEEVSAKPLSDQAMAVELNRRGIEVARRTVAKYRESMNIPPSNERCRMA
ncbi:MAG: RNA polymerase factor sigma-54 [Dokdonella sp.]